MLGGSCSQVEPCSPQGRTWGSGQDHSSLCWQCSLQVPAHFGLARSMTVFCLDFFSDSFVCISTTAARCLMPATGAAPLTGLPAPSVSGPDWPAVPRCLAMHFWLSHLIKLFKPRAPMGESGGNAGPGCFNWLLACVHTCIAASAESSRAITDGQGVKMYTCVAKRSLPWKLCNWRSVGSTPKIRILPFFYCRASLPPPHFYQSVSAELVPLTYGWAWGGSCSTFQWWALAGFSLTGKSPAPLPRWGPPGTTLRQRLSAFVGPQGDVDAQQCLWMFARTTYPSLAATELCGHGSSWARATEPVQQHQAGGSRHMLPSPREKGRKERCDSHLFYFQLSESPERSKRLYVCWPSVSLSGGYCFYAPT